MRFLFYSATAVLWLLLSPQPASAEEAPDAVPQSEAEFPTETDGFAQENREETLESEPLEPQQSENATPNPGEAAQAEAQDPAKAERKMGVGRLISKLKRKDGTAVNFGVLVPIDYTTLDFAEVSLNTILSSISRYGEFGTRVISSQMSALTLDEFRRIVVTQRLEVVIVTVLKPTNFDIFLYDRRTPYNIYAHSETLPEEVQYRLTREVTEQYVKLIVRKVLFAYMQEDSFELPREEAPTVTGSEIPRWVASARNLEMLNREILSRFYASVSVGAALTKGETGLWNSNMVGVQVGLRLIDNLYAEAALDMFSYNAASAGFRYIFQNKDNPFRLSVGLAGALSTNAYALNWDQNYTQGLGSQYVVPSVAVMLPIVEVHFKIETKFFIALDSPRFIVGLMPGLLVLF